MIFFTLLDSVKNAMQTARMHPIDTYEMICNGGKENVLTFFVLPRIRGQTLSYALFGCTNKLFYFCLIGVSAKRRKYRAECSMSLNFCTESTIIVCLPSFNLISNVWNSFGPDLLRTMSEHSFNVRSISSKQSPQKNWHTFIYMPRVYALQASYTLPFLVANDPKEPANKCRNNLRTKYVIKFTILANMHAQ